MKGFHIVLPQNEIFIFYINFFEKIGFVLTKSSKSDIIILATEM